MVNNTKLGGVIMTGVFLRDKIFYKQVLLVITASLLFGLCDPKVSFADPEGTALEEVVVTGSRIARDSNLTGAQPVQGFDAEEIVESGEFALIDVISEIPALVGSLTQEMTIDSTDPDGANLLDLRNLGVNRTLTLVNGRRHVGGLQGSSAVDLGSIAKIMVDRVEVLTGGASAVYGADAVTGVVNIILKDSFEGFALDVTSGASSDWDAHQNTISAMWGKNFSDGKGNITFAVEYADDAGLKMGERPGETFGSGDDWANPDFRFQAGDITGNTPNFQRYYNYENTGFFPVGLNIPTSDDFISDYNSAFGTEITAGDLTSAELALIGRAANAFPRAILPEGTFSITSGYGYIIPGNPFTFAGFDPEVAIDLNNNQVPDCLESFAGYNSVFGAGSFGVVGGCWVQQADGSFGVTQDGLVAGNFNGFGGSSMDVLLNDAQQFLLPDRKTAVNLNGSYEINDKFKVLTELKYVVQSTNQGGGANSFWDLLFGAADNPFLPEFIQGVASEVGGVAITVDPIYFGNQTITERETYRAVFAIEGEFESGMRFEASVNYGKHERETENTNQVIVDRFFAAIDATTDPLTGNPACRSSVDPTASALNTPFGIPAYEEGYFSFIPGDGQCAPLNIWAGAAGPSQAAKDFVLTDALSQLELEQFVVSASITGDTETWFSLPAGPIDFALGAEYRDEESTAIFSTWDQGILPEGSNFPAGTLISDYSANGSLIFDPGLASNNESGSFDVTEFFLELAIPLLKDQPGAKELSLDLAGRFSDYSTIDTTSTWRATLVYAPIDDLTFRGTVSEAVRAPNITELFGPVTSATFRPSDPCDATYISGLEASLASNVQANCVTYFQGIGLDPFTDGEYSFLDPLSARFGGLTGGNPDLIEETAETITYGFVFTPSAIPGLAITLDYWDIEIEDAITTVRADDIVLGCYQGASLNNQFCDLFTRNTDSSSLQFGGFNFMRTGQLNFAKFETDGYDLSASYDFSFNEHFFRAELIATKVEDLAFFQNPLDPTEKNPELSEITRPELSGIFSLSYAWQNLRLKWRAQFLDEMLLGQVERETYESIFGPSVLMDETWIHNISGSYVLNDEITVGFGVQNLTDEKPFITQSAYPATSRGTSYWASVRVLF